MSDLIRNAKPEDIGTLANIFIRAYAGEPWNEPNWKYEQAYARISDLVLSPNALCLTYDEDGVIKGAILCKLLSWHDGKKIEWHELFIDSNQQGQGIGKKLIRRLEAEAINLGANEINFWTIRTPGAVNLVEYYSRLGYQVTKNRVVMVKDIK